jgi:phosphate-selective porin OprO/OprP
MRVDTRDFVLITVLILTAVLAPRAYGEEVPDLIIHNVYIVGTGSQTENTLVNIQIVGNKIKLVSKDKITARNNTQVLDAKNGYLLGKLSVGSAPQFMILSDDPTADLNILLDTKQFVRFAVNDGHLVVNKLQPVLGEPDDPGAKPAKSRWLAYEPPPFAIPTSVEASNKWNAYRTKYTNGLFFSALALDRQLISQDADSRTQFGDLGDFERGTIRAWRFGFAGTVNFDTPWVYNVTFAWNPFDRGFDEELEDFQFMDYGLSIPASKNVTVSIGNLKEPINMEKTMTLLDLAGQERSAVSDAMFSTRNFGVVVSGTAPDQRVSWAGGVFNDWLVDSGSFDENATVAVGRVTWLPVISEDQSELFHVGLGVRHSDAKAGLQYGSRPELGDAPKFVDTGFFDAESSTLYNLEAGWRSGPYWLLAEYTDNDVDAPDVGNPRFKGYHISGTWSLSGEMRPYRKPSGAFGGLPVAQNVNQGGWGAWELGLRFSSIDLTDGDIAGGDMDVATAQVAWWATRNMLVSFNYRRSWTDRFGFDGEMDAASMRVALFLQ